MKNKNLQGILALVVVTALSFGVIAGSNALAKNSDVAAEDGASSAAADAGEVTEEIDVAGAEGIEKAVKTENGYMVTVKTKGYGGDILMNVCFDKDAKNVTAVEVVENSETENVGARIAEAEFLDQFKGVAAPVYLPGMTVGAADTADDAADAAEEPAALNDGEYVAATTERDENGFIDQVTMTVKDGRITEANWEALLEDGTKKSEMSENGQYTMTEDGPTWAEESKALTDGLIENQSLAFLAVDDTGHTDAVASVSIYVGGFAALADDCLKQAAGTGSEEPAEEEAAPQDGTQVDGISGATISSTAAVKAINLAFDFIQTVK